MTNIFFTSDSHFGHANIIKYCNRPFANIHEHDETLIENWNSVVKMNDIVYHLGDFGFGSQDFLDKIASKLHGQKFLIRGNHDKVFRKVNHTNYLDWIKDMFELRIPDEEMDLKQNIVLCHYPMISWSKSHHGSWMLHGHCHGTLMVDDTAARIDVGVDCFDYKPVSYEEIKYEMTKKVFKPVDHHKER